MTKAYAFFDVDGTVIRKDSFRLLLFHGLRSSPWRIALFVLLLPIFLVAGLRAGEKRYVKSTTLWCLTAFRGKRGATVFLRDALKPYFESLWFPQMEGVLADLRQQGVRVCYVSASGQTWIRSLLHQMDPGKKTVIGSRLGFFAGGVIMKSKNCYNTEKIVRIEDLLGQDLEWKCGYSDHIADLPMLARCKERYLISPKDAHRKIFEETFGKQCVLLEWQDSNSN